MIRYPTIALLTLLLSACVGAPQKDSECSCADYLPTAQRPSWVDGESIKGGIYRSHGIAECSGVKSIDFDDADQRARTKLSRMISVDVESEVTLIRRELSATVGGSAGSQIESRLASSAILENSVLFGRWIDTASCTIYSGIRLAKSDINRTLRRLQAVESRRLYNQPFAVAALSSEQHQGTIRSSLQRALSEQGVGRIAPEAVKGSFLLTGELGRIDVLNRQRLYRLSLKLTITDPGGATLWSQQVRGKALAFSAKPPAVMVESALDDALAKSVEALKKVLQQEIPE